jgi:N-acetyl-anhydromuramyl-L-alanine amidase AmpD
MRYNDVSNTTSSAVTKPRLYYRSLIVLHTTMGTNSLPWLQGGSTISGKPVSSDYLVDRLGNIFQITKPYWYAFHTGRAYWRGKQEADCTLNQQAIGVEFECAEQAGEQLTNLQVISGAALIKRLCEYHGLDLDDITTHAVIALPPGRKDDPRILDWMAFVREMQSPSVESRDLVFPAVLP